VLAYGAHHIAHRVGVEAAMEGELMHTLADVLQRLLLFGGELGAAGSVDLNPTRLENGSGPGPSRRW
jgi:hypothetical protein